MTVDTNLPVDVSMVLERIHSAFTDCP